MPTLKGRVLLGWMPEGKAVDFLQNQCFFDPPLGDAGARALWRKYRDTVVALPPRAFSPVPSLGLTPAETGHSARVMAHLASLGRSEVIGLKKIDLRELVVHQYYVTTGHADNYAKRLHDSKAWLNEALPLAVTAASISYRVRQNGMSSYIEIDVPHGEWTFGPLPTPGLFAPLQGLRHVTVMDGPDRTFLWAGYHRSFAKVLTTPIANAPTVLVAVARNVMTPPPVAGAAPGVMANAGIDDFCAFGVKAPRLGDFFVDGLFMDVDLKEKRFQLQIHANWAAIDAP